LSIEQEGSEDFFDFLSEEEDYAANHIHDENDFSFLKCNICKEFL
jgi:hypothetical protein